MNRVCGVGRVEGVSKKDCVGWSRKGDAGFVVRASAWSAFGPWHLLVACEREEAQGNHVQVVRGVGAGVVAGGMYYGSDAREVFWPILNGGGTFWCAV